MSKIEMSDCPRYMKCGANVCPLDPGMLRRTHIPGEPVCLLMTEYAKPGGPARVFAYAGPEVCARVGSGIAELRSSSPAHMPAQSADRPRGHGTVLAAIERAKDTASRFDQWAASGARLRAMSEAEDANETL